MADEKALILHGYLEQKAEAIIRRTWEQAEKIGLAIEHAPDSVRPHLTLGSWQLAELTPGLAEKTVAALAGLPPFGLRCNIQLGTGGTHVHFNLVPIVQHDLLTFHEHVHAALPRIGRAYRAADMPGTWIPHISLFHCAEDDLVEAYQVVKCLALPFAGRIDSMGLVLYGTGSMQKVASFDLATA
jgi:hypothetical protein